MAPQTMIGHDDVASSTIRPSPVRLVSSGSFPPPADLSSQYSLVAPLGKGGMAEVFLAAWEATPGQRHPVVIKRLYPHFGDDPNAVRMFLNEGRLVCALDHPNIVKTFEVGLMNDQYCIVMEYLMGQPLKQIMRSALQTGGLPLDVAVRIAGGILAGLSYAHEARDPDGKALEIVHRDITPHNVFVTNDGVVKLLDFGIAKAQCHEGRTATGLVKGKFAYLAPEQAQGPTVDARADLWSLGVVLWEMLTGERLFRRENDAATLRATLRDEIRPPSSIRPTIPTELDRIVLQALQRQASLRYASAAEMHRDLCELLPRHHHLDNGPLCLLMQTLFAEEHAEQRALVRALRDVPTPVLSQSVSVCETSPTTVTATARAVSMEVSRLDTLVRVMEQRNRTTYRMMAAVLAIALIAIFAVLILSTPHRQATVLPREQQTTIDRKSPIALDGHTLPPKHAKPVESQPIEAAAFMTTNVTTHKGAQKHSRLAGSAPPVTAKLKHVGGSNNGQRSSEAAQPASYGYLTLDTSPWSQVSANGRLLGQTPLVSVQLPTGTQVLTLRNPDTEIVTQYVVTIEPGKTTAKRIGLE